MKKTYGIDTLLTNLLYNWNIPLDRKSIEHLDMISGSRLCLVMDYIALLEIFF